MSLSEMCSNLVSKKSSREQSSDKNVMEFISAPWGLDIGRSTPPLYPAQRCIVKCYYGLELDGSNDRDIIINDRFNEKRLYMFNEIEYMNYLYNEGRTNRRYEPYSFPNLVLVLGRRSGKTVMTAVIISYELYKLLNKYSPQDYYGIMPEDEIKMSCISTSRENAGELYNKVTGHVERSEFFRKYRSKPTAEYIKFRTQRDIDKYGQKGRASIIVRVAPCSAKGLRGPSNMVIGLDEMAHFFEEENNGKKAAANQAGDKTDRAIYDAVTPSVAKFSQSDGTPDGKIICISSPAGKFGKFYEEYERGYEESNDDLFVIQAPTWEIDPNLSSSYLRRKYKENPISFRSEFGAEFSDRMFGWVDDPDLVRQNYVPGLSYKLRGAAKVPHFMGIDIGLKNDGSAVAVGHWVEELVGGAKEEILEVDKADVRYAEKEDKKNFIPDELVDWIAGYTQAFYIYKGLMDQYYGLSIVPGLEKLGLKQFEYRQFTDALNSETYQNFLTMMISSEFRFPDNPKAITDNPKEEDTELVKEILSLQAEQKSKYIIKVFAPERAGSHDDLSDAVSRLALLAVEYRNKGFGSKKIASSGAVQVRKSYMMQRRAEIRKAQLGRPSGRFIGNAVRNSMMPTLNRSFR